MSTPRRTKERVRTARRRSQSSTLWLQRQLNDPFVHAAKSKGYRARSVFKLAEIDRRYKLLRRGARVIDLGAAPGSWSQYAAERGCVVVALDLLPMEPLPGVDMLQGDFLDPAVQDEAARSMGGPADTVLSDIAPSATGQRSVDRLRAEAIGEAVLDFAGRTLAPGGSCLVKLVKGAEAALVPLAIRHFTGYRLIKPEATRSESSEIYLLATGRREMSPIAEDA
jgi:23S rRNA (uridine2552-2'-O)-methyltransferase